MTPLTKYAVVGVRADGSRVILWHGDSRESAIEAERRMKHISGYTGGVCIESYGKRVSQGFAYDRPE
jgi:hypothetical protein